LSKSIAVASLSHDPKIDDPALIAALNSQAFYIGALGSTRTQEKRRQRLLKTGISEDAIARLNAPIGIEIGAETPEEIALAIMAQIISAYRK
jgi:xanthine dehydrogenase accessory factor